MAVVGSQCQFAAADGGVGYGLLLCWFVGCLVIVGSLVSWLVCWLALWLARWLAGYGLLVGCAAIQHALLRSLDICACML